MSNENPTAASERPIGDWTPGHWHVDQEHWVSAATIWLARTRPILDANAANTKLMAAAPALAEQLLEAYRLLCAFDNANVNTKYAPLREALEAAGVKLE